MILELTVAAIGGGIVGFFACAVMTAGKVGDEQIALTEHSRAADALNTKQSRIDRALERLRPGANANEKLIARILKGDA